MQASDSILFTYAAMAPKRPQMSSAHFQTHDALSHTYSRQFIYMFTGSISAKSFLNPASLLEKSHHQIPASIQKLFLILNEVSEK